MNERDLNTTLQEMTQIIWASAILREAGRLAGNESDGKAKKILPSHIEIARNELAMAWKAASEDSGFDLI